MVTNKSDNLIMSNIKRHSFINSVVLPLSWVLRMYSTCTLALESGHFPFFMSADGRSISAFWFSKFKLSELHQASAAMSLFYVLLILSTYTARSSIMHFLFGSIRLINSVHFRQDHRFGTQATNMGSV